MIKVKRHPKNPILTPEEDTSWEAVAAFNGCPVKGKDQLHFLYRAASLSQRYFGQDVELSSIGHAVSKDGVSFKKRRLFIAPEYQWEQFGCEDPRVTYLNGKYFIFYTALGDYPPSPEGIKIGLVTTRDFIKIEEEHQVTHFNSKAMALFPEKINHQMVAILTVNTDRPPAKIALAFFDQESQIWSKQYWDQWLVSLDKHILPLQRKTSDHVEVGAPPIKTEQGWLVIYAHIQRFQSHAPLFGIEAVMLDFANPLKIIGRTRAPLLVPREEYELYGRVPSVIFPSGALLNNGQLSIYYGAADTTCCLATLKMEDLMAEMFTRAPKKPKASLAPPIKLERHEQNPIIKPLADHPWEAKYTFNPAAIYEAGKVHVVYRAVSEDHTSTLGYASSQDGVHIDERLDQPIYVPRESFEKKVKAGFSGCEDPRLTKIGGTLYMCYTAFDGKSPTKIALTSIEMSDFLDKKWHWAKPIVISSPERSDKNACLFPEKIKGKYVFFHRIGGCIWIDFVDDLSFQDDHRLGGKMILCSRPGKWDSKKIGIAGPPIKTPDGWLLIYHGLSREDKRYRLGALLLDLENPAKIIRQLDYPILEPEKGYEHEKFRPGTVFACGNVVIKDRLFVYYGASDRYVCVASTNFGRLLAALK